MQTTVLRPPPAILDPAVTRIFALVAVLGGVGVGFAAGLGVSQNLLIGAVLAPFLLMFLYARPHWAVSVYVVLVYADLLSILVKYHDFPPLARFAGPVLLSAVLGYRFIYRREKLRRDQVTPWMIAYGVVVALGLIYARDTNLVMDNVIEFARNFFTYLVVVNALTTAKRLNVTLWLVLGMGTLLALLSIYQVGTGHTDNDFGGLAQYRVSEITSQTDSARPGGTIGDANFYGQSLLILVPIAFYFAFRGRNLLAKAAGLFCALALVGGIVFTYSRGDALALGALFLGALVYKRPKLPVLLGLGIAAALAIQVLPANYTARLSTLVDAVTGSQQTLYTEESLRGRAGAVQAAIAMFADHPILGVGRENYPLYQLQYLEGTAIALRAKAIPPHDLYLEIATENGLVGLIVFGGLLVVVFRSIREARRRFLSQMAPREAELASWLGIGLFAYLVSCLFLHGAFLYMLWLQVAFIVALRQISRAQEVEPLAERPPAPETVAPVLPFVEADAPRSFILPTRLSGRDVAVPKIGVPLLPTNGTNGANGSAHNGHNELQTTLLSPGSLGLWPAERFRSFYEASGGEAMFGEPLSDVFEEARAEGIVPVQYYEYARLEYRPGEGVAMGDIGLEVPVEDTPAVLLPPGLTGGQVPLGPDGFHVPVLLYEAWEAIGGAAMSGYPASPVLVAASPEGLPIYVQYFERARLEYHPEHEGTAYEVQRTPLGTQVFAARYGVVAEPASAGEVR